MRIKRLTLQTAKPDELRRFYSETLELKLVSAGDHRVSIRIGDTTLEFKQARAGDPFYHFAINIPSNKIPEKARDWLTDKKIGLLRVNESGAEIAEFTNWHARSVYFLDPVGNIVELIARFDLNNPREDRFGPSHFLQISEVGLVYQNDQLARQANWLLSEFGLGWFDKQPPLAQFKVIGDDEGLFIIVPENRNWYPTDIASGRFPLDLEFVANGTLHELRL